MIQINIPDRPDTIQDLVFEGTDYKVNFTFFTRDSSWRISLFDFNGNTLLSGVKIIPDWFLMTNFHISQPSIPKGDFVCIKFTEDASEELGRDNLGQGKSFRLFYLTEEEMLNGI